MHRHNHLIPENIAFLALMSIANLLFTTSALQRNSDFCQLCFHMKCSGLHSKHLYTDDSRGERGRLHPCQMFDRAPEFLTRDVLQHLAELKIAVTLVTSYSCCVNGVIETQHRQIQDLTSTTLLQFEGPQKPRPHALRHARIVLNSTHTCTIGTSILHHCTGEELAYSQFCLFECAVLVCTQGPGCLEPRAQHGVNLGPPDAKYILLSPSKHVASKKTSKMDSCTRSSCTVENC